ncbi:MAG: hypothetical protein ACPIA1_04735 [Flavobacteriaceae bacterium]
MRQLILVLVSTLILFNQEISAQEYKVKFDDFIYEHKGLSNQVGELVPINIDEIERKIGFYVEEKLPGIIEYTDNIIWDSYQTVISHSTKTHNHKFIALVKLRNVDELKFFNVVYNPLKKTVKGYSKWSAEENEFYFEADFLAKEATKPNLVALEIANQANKPQLNDFITSHEGFIRLMEEKNRGQSNYVPLDINVINEKIKSFIGQTFGNVDYTRNVTWKTYETFISPYSLHHYHTFLVQVMVSGMPMVKYLDVYLNPKTDKISTDFKWDDRKKKFVK